MEQDHAQYFNDEVDVAVYPDYTEVIEKPVHFRRILNRLTRSRYDSLAKVKADIDLLFDNAYRYNEGNDECVVAAGRGWLCLCVCVCVLAARPPVCLRSSFCFFPQR